MELRHLRYFVTVAELLNFTKSAAKLRVAQPALSRQIRDLEEELGVPLFERSSRFVRLTEAGAAFAAEARAVLERVGEARRAVQAFASGERGRLQLGYAPSPTAELLPQALHAFNITCPGVRVTLHDLSGQQMHEYLREGRLDAALTVAPSAKEMRGLKFEKLRTYPFCVAMNKAHRLARRRQVNLSQLKSERLITYTEADYPEYHTWLSDVFASVDSTPNIGEQHDSATSLIAAVEAGTGIAVVPSVLACLSGPRLVMRDLEPSLAPLVVGLAYPRRYLSPSAERFKQAVLKMV